jgi:CheY-like chemotaxis protein
MKTVLLIDDSRFQRIANERMLTRAGYNVILAADGEEALCAAWQHQPDVILLDLLLPKLSGLEVLQLLKREPKTSGIPIIVLTSMSQANADRLIRAGAAAFIQKESILEKPEQLLRQIAAVLTKPNVPSTQVFMRGDLEITWANRKQASELPTFMLEFLPEPKEGLGSYSVAVEGKTALEEHLRRFDIGLTFLESWLSKLKQEDIQIPYVGITHELAALYGI